MNSFHFGRAEIKLKANAAGRNKALSFLGQKLISYNPLIRIEFKWAYFDWLNRHFNYDICAQTIFFKFLLYLYQG